MVSSHLLVYFHNDVCQLRESLEILNFENKTKMSLINSQDSLRNFSKFSFSVSREFALGHRNRISPLQLENFKRQEYLCGGSTTYCLNRE